MLRPLSEQAQNECAADVARPVDCHTWFTVDPSGTIARLEISQCGGATPCVRRIFRRAVFPRFSGEPAQTGIFFSIPDTAARTR